jgi:ATP-dependent Lhr-like helicase
VISGLIQRYQPNADKNRRQVTVNSDLIYDVLRKHQPDHILLRATRADAQSGLTDINRIALLLERAHGRVVHMALSRVSPLAVPVLLEIGRERVAAGVTEEQLLLEAEVLVAEAMNPNEPPAPRRAKGKSAVPGQAVLAGIR